MVVEFTESFVVEDLGVQEIEVYDLEVEDNHNFFANNILVHNSNYFSLQPIIKKMGLSLEPSKELIDAIDQFCEKKLGKNIADSCAFIADSQNCFENHLIVKREKISQSGIWVSKKRYALLAWDNEGVRYKEPEVSVTGLEVKRSSTPLVCRQSLKEGLKICLEGTEKEIQDFVKVAKEKFMAEPLENIAIPSGVKGLDYYSDPKTIYKINGCPQHVKASLLYNHYLKTHGLGGKYNPIQEGTKMRRVPLFMPNPIGEEIIGFGKELPKEFGLHDYIDYEYLFEKTFMVPMQRITEAMKWQLVKKSTLDDFFS